MKNKPEPDSDLILYRTEDGRTRLQVRLDGGTVWLSLNQLADLFQRDKSVISRLIKNVFEEGELSEDATVAKSATVQTEGGKQVTREIEFYNLDVIISVGYRVKSQRGTQFRIWATQRLREYIVKGFTMDDERLKNPPDKGHIDYFDELLERIRDIRSSERRMYLRVREILALAADYEATEPETQVFFQTIQDKLHFAATGKTAAELIAERAMRSSRRGVRGGEHRSTYYQNAAQHRQSDALHFQGDAPHCQSAAQRYQKASHSRHNGAHGRQDAAHSSMTHDQGFMGDAPFSLIDT